MHVAPGCARLYDLIKISDARLRPAVYYAMGNTLVAKDLDQASRIAYGNDRRFRRVVTLQVRRGAPGALGLRHICASGWCWACTRGSSHLPGSLVML